MGPVGIEFVLLGAMRENREGTNAPGLLPSVESTGTKGVGVGEGIARGGVDPVADLGLVAASWESLSSNVG